MSCLHAESPAKWVMLTMWKGIALGTLFFSILVGFVQDGATALAVEGGGDLPAQPLTLERAVDLGLQRNRTLKAVQEELEAVGQQVRQVRGDFFPRVDSSYTITHLKDEPFATLGISGVPVVGSPEFPTAPQTTNRWQVELTQPIFTGFALTSRFNISRLDYKIAQYKVEETRLSITRDVRYAFLQVLLGEKLLQVARDNVQSLEVQRRNAQANFQEGFVAHNDVLKAEVALAQARQRERAAAKQLVLLRSRLNQLFDLDLHARLELAEASFPQHPVPSLEELYAIAEARRPELMSVETSIQQAGEALTAARSRFYPRLSAFAQYYREGEDFLASDNPFTNNENAAIGLKVDWNWFEGGKTQAATREVLFKRKALEERLRELKQQIRIQVEDAYEQLQVARMDMEASETALRQAEENERMTSMQYREQLVIFLEVLNAQVFLSQSRVDYHQARYGYHLALADLERAIGGPLPEKTGGGN